MYWYLATYWPLNNDAQLEYLLNTIERALYSKHGRSFFSHTELVK